MKDASQNRADVAGHGAVCERCGPHLRLLDREGNRLVSFAEALVQAGFGILRGEIVGLRGFGEMHYLADSRLDGAIMRLRMKAGLNGGDLPLMYSSVVAARVDFAVSEFDENLLTAPDMGPVKLLRMRSAKETPLAGSIAGADPIWFAVLLARTRLHRLLLSQLNGPVVAVDRGMIPGARSGKNATASEPVADFVLELTCPAWVPEECQGMAGARCALADRPERRGPQVCANRSLS